MLAIVPMIVVMSFIYLVYNKRLKILFAMPLCGLVILFVELFWSNNLGFYQMLVDSFENGFIMFSSTLIIICLSYCLGKLIDKLELIEAIVDAVNRKFQVGTKLHLITMYAMMTIVFIACSSSSVIAITSSSYIASFKLDSHNARLVSRIVNLALITGLSLNPVQIAIYGDIIGSLGAEHNYSVVLGIGLLLFIVSAVTSLVYIMLAVPDVEASDNHNTSGSLSSIHLIGIAMPLIGLVAFGLLLIFGLEAFISIAVISYLIAILGLCFTSSYHKQPLLEIVIIEGCQSAVDFILLLISSGFLITILTTGKYFDTSNYLSTIQLLAIVIGSSIIVYYKPVTKYFILTVGISLLVLNGVGLIITVTIIRLMLVVQAIEPVEDYHQFIRRVNNLDSYKRDINPEVEIEALSELG